MSHRTLGIIVCSLSVALLGGCASSGNGAACPKSATNAVVKSEEVPAQTAQDAPAAAAQADRVDASGLFGASEADDALRHSQKDADLMLFESWPDETTLDNDFIANVVPVWIEAIESAQKTLDFEEFYAIAADDSLPKTAATQALTKVIDAVKDAAARGVKVRFIVDKKMSSGENGVLPEELTKIPGVELRIISYADIRAVYSIRNSSSSMERASISGRRTSTGVR